MIKLILTITEPKDALNPKDSVRVAEQVEHDDSTTENEARLAMFLRKQVMKMLNPKHTVFAKTIEDAAKQMNRLIQQDNAQNN